MAEKRALDELARQCRHIEGHERPATAGTELVQVHAPTSSLPVPLSPRTRTVAFVGGDPFDQLAQLANGAAIAEHRAGGGRLAARAVGRPFADQALPAIGEMVDDAPQAVQVDGLGQVIDGSESDRGDGVVDRAKSREHRHLEIRLPGEHLAQDFEPVVLAKADVQQEQLWR